MYKLFVKRLLDLPVAFVALIVLSPVFVISAVFVLLSSPGPIFYTQGRVGLDRKVFRIYKFRSMHVNHSRQNTQTLNNDPEVFPAGRVMRRFKIDELPQIYNVLKGDMSIVGPRPCLEITLQEMPEWAWQRFEVRPGLTGLAQINGNIALNWVERWRYDVSYVESISLHNDFKIILNTIAVVILGEERFKKII